MIVDTSALVAILYREDHYDRLRDAILEEGGSLPSPALVEYLRVSTKRGSVTHPAAKGLLESLESSLAVEAFTPDDAQAAAAGNMMHGVGNGRGGTLNLLDLMVYGMAKRMDRPILCTGRDFAATDIAIHPASRPW